MLRPRPWQRQSKRIRRNKCILSRPADFFGGPGVFVLYGRAGCPRLSARQPPNHHGGVRARRPTQGDHGLRRGGALPLPRAICHWCGNPHPRPHAPLPKWGLLKRWWNIFSNSQKIFIKVANATFESWILVVYYKHSKKKTGCGPNHNKEELYNEEMGMFCLRLCSRGRHPSR